MELEKHEIAFIINSLYSTERDFRKTVYNRNSTPFQKEMARNGSCKCLGLIAKLRKEFDKEEN